MTVPWQTLAGRGLVVAQAVLLLLLAGIVLFGKDFPWPVVQVLALAQMTALVPCLRAPVAGRFLLVPALLLHATGLIVFPLGIRILTGQPVLKTFSVHVLAELHPWVAGTAAVCHIGGVACFFVLLRGLARSLDESRIEKRLGRALVLWAVWPVLLLAALLATWQSVDLWTWVGLPGVLATLIVVGYSLVIYVEAIIRLQHILSQVPPAGPTDPPPPEN